MATPAASPTGRNLAATGTARLGLGHTRDVSMIEGDVEVLEIDALPREQGDRSPSAPASTRARSPRPTAGFACPRAASGLARVNELPARELMRDGRWLVDTVTTPINARALQDT